MTLNGIKLHATNENINDIDSTIANTAVDGSVHGYFLGSHKQITFATDWISEEDRNKLVEARENKVLLVLDNGEKYNVRFSYSGFEPVYINGERVYNTTITAVEVVT